VRCTLFCATDGDAGKSQGKAPVSAAELGATRRRELTAAAKILGITTLDLRGHPDGALAGVDQDQLIGEIVAHIRRERPGVLITFGPEGAPNTHRDHRAISRAATAAFFLAGNPSAFSEQLRDGLAAHAPGRLFYATWPPPAPGAALQVRGLSASARIDVRPFIETEWAAFRAHESQSHLRDRFAELCVTNDELFALAVGVPQSHGEIHDLFADL
jgi:LmbE family N-acetylglucosaminyl deacetylase